MKLDLECFSGEAGMQTLAKARATLGAIGLTLGTWAGCASAAVIEQTIPLSSQIISFVPYRLFGVTENLNFSIASGDDVMIRFRFDLPVNPQNNPWDFYQFGISGRTDAETRIDIIGGVNQTDYPALIFTIVPNGGDLSFRYVGEDFIATAGFGFTQPVPEPSTWAMMLLGFAGLAVAAGRRRDVLLSPG